MFPRDYRQQRLRPASLVAADRVVQSLLHKGVVDDEQILEAVDAFQATKRRERSLWRVLASSLPEQRATILREAAVTYGYREFHPALSDIVEYLNEVLGHYDRRTWGRLVAERTIPVAPGANRGFPQAVIFGADDPSRRSVRALFDELAPTGSEQAFLRPPLVTFLTRRLIPSLLEPARAPLEARIFKPRVSDDGARPTGTDPGDLKRAA